MSPPVRKTYFLTNKCENKFPLDFINSTNTKYIEVHPCYISRIQNPRPDQYEKGILMHGDFVQRDFYVDHALCFCNDKRSKYKKYEYHGQKETFNLSFTSIIPLITINFEPEADHYIDEPYDGETDVYNYATAQNLLLNIYPEHEDDINDLYKNLQDNNWKSNTGLLSKSRYIEDPASSKYSYYDFVDHVSQLYGRKPGSDIEYLPNTDYSYDDTNYDVVVYTDKMYLVDPYLDRKFTRVKTTKYHKIDEDQGYKFFAEFLFMY